MFPEVVGLLLFNRLPPVLMVEDARLRIRLAHQALTQMPPGLDSSAARYLVDGSLPVRALDAVGRFLDRNEWPHPGELHRQLSASTIGPGEGHRIVALGVVDLVRAVDELHHSQGDLATVARRADRALQYACQANESGKYTWDALTYLEFLQNRLYGRLPGKSLAPSEEVGHLPTEPAGASPNAAVKAS